MDLMPLVIRTRLLAALFAPVLAMALVPPAEGGVLEHFEDPEDGAFDMSEWLLDRKGFFLVPLVITEPAVGFGGGAALVFFRESLRDREIQAAGRRRTPPDIFGSAFAATENGTQFQGLGGLLTSDEDRWRYRGGGARARVNLAFYGAGASPSGGSGVEYQLEGWAMSHQLSRRIARTNQFAAVRWVYLDLDSRFPASAQFPELSGGTTRRSSGLGVAWQLDSRDNFFTASRGVLTGLEGLFYDPTWGSDESFQTYRGNMFGYVPVDQRLVVGLRLDGRAARGDVPFYQLPYIVLRGIPAARYQGESVAVAESELRWNATSRWAVIGFVGMGRAWGRLVDFEDASLDAAGGGGFRYLVARRLGMYAGIDVGWGPEDRAVYIQMGSAWR